MARSPGALQYQGHSAGAVAFDPRDIGHVGAHQSTRNVGALMNLPPSVKPGLPRLNTSHELAAGLIGAWPMAQLSGTTVEDLSGSGNDGTADAASWEYDPQEGPHFLTHGSGDPKVVVPNAAISGITTAMTCRVRFRNSQTETVAYGQVLGVISGGRGFCIERTNTLDRWTARFDTSTADRQSVNSLTYNAFNGDWHELCVTWDGSTARLYQDGSFSGSGAVTGSIETGGDLWIGDSNGNSVYNNGFEFATVEVWDRALSAAEISRMYADPWALYEVTQKPEYPVLDTSNPLADSLVVALPLSEGGGTTVTDISGNGNHGTAEGGVTWNSDTTRGPFIDLDGTDGKVGLQEGALSSHIGTIAMWFRSSQVSGRGTLYSEGSTSSNNPVVMLETYTSSDKLQFWLRDDNGDNMIAPNLFRTTASPIDGEWHHVALVLDGSGAQFYIDGLPDNTETFALTDTLTTNTVNVGALEGATTGFYFNGNIADVQVFDRALPASDVADLAEDPWLLYLDGDPEVTGTSDATIDNLTGSGSGTVTSAGGVTGTSDATIDNLTGSGSGTVTSTGEVTGTSDATINNLTGEGTGTVINPVTGTSDATIGNLTGSGAGTYVAPDVTGTSDATIAALTGSGTGNTGTPTATGTSDATIAALTGAGAGTVLEPTRTGTSDATIRQLTGIGVGSVINPVMGTSDATIANLTGDGDGTSPDGEPMKGGGDWGMWF